MLAHLTKMKVKKWRKIRHKLENDGFSVIDEKSCFIVAANAGLGNGISVGQVKSLLVPFKTVLNIESFANKSYAVICFESDTEAMQCVESLQGHVLVKHAEEKESILYLFYIKDIPAFDKKLSSTIDKPPNGLHICEDFITAQEESELMERIEVDINTLSQQHIQEDLKQRTVIHYGYKFRYGSNDVDCNLPLDKEGLPDFTRNLLDRIMKTGYFQSQPDQLTINKYNPGDGIPPHIDNPDAFGCALATLSLGSSVAMEMKSLNDQKATVLLKPRTLTVFTGDSRYKWTHSIPAKKTDVVFDESANEQCLLKRELRISMTFRTVLPSTNNYLSKNVLTEKEHFIPKDQNEAVDLENKLVHNVYNDIACHFSSTRDKPWPRVVKFLQSLKPGSTVVDVGCGSGRYLKANPNILILGCDYSSSLTTICSEKGDSVFTCDGLNLPLKTDYFDASICIAVIHHYSTYERRLASLMELTRVIRNGGLCLIYVWAAEQKLNDVDSNYLKQANKAVTTSNQSKIPEKETNFTKSDLGELGSNRLLVHKNRTEFVQQDVLVPWTMKKGLSKTSGINDSTYYRFYHVFKRGELETLCQNIPNCSIVDSYYDNGNWSVTLLKK